MQVRPDHEVVGIRRGSRHGFVHWATATLAFRYNVKLLSTLKGSGLGWFTQVREKRVQRARCEVGFDSDSFDVNCSCSLSLVCVAGNFQVADHE
jgi:hypothetical protein